MPGKLLSWPDWVEFETAPKSRPHEEDFAKAKAEIIKQYGQEALTRAWQKVCKELQGITDDLVARGNDIVPIFDFEDLKASKGLSDAQKAQIKATGCCIVRNTLPEKLADAHFQDLKSFVADNKGNIRGWPAESPAMLSLFNSPTQIKIRTHPNQIFLQRELNNLFHDKSNESSPEPLSYTDAARIRPPGQVFLGLGPHIDAGSLCRWVDPQYRKVYDRILAGYPEEHDAYDLEVRKEADQYLYPAKAHSVVFRAFQGWTALTPASPSCGTLLLYPNVAATIAYTVLRPFFKAPQDENMIMDGTKWTFDAESTWFPGTAVEQSQRLSISSHPHLRLRDCLMHIPPMKAGDTVWWHTDMCHAVDPAHNGDSDASVVYIAACPTTRINKDYVRQQLQAALAGQPPPDSIGLDIDETKLKGYEGYDNVLDDARRVLGFDLH